MSESAAAGQVITFYSYKGGTGRTMALANVACLLTRTISDGRGVLMIDWDLEAPGLHRYFQGLFRRQFAEAPDPVQALDAQPGLIDMFAELESVTRELHGQAEEVANAALQSVPLERFVLETDIPALYMLKAGRFDDQYSTLVNRFDWEALYARSPMLFSLFAEQLADKYRFVLIDSRTGLTDTSGICTTLLPERLVLVFTPNRQSLTGVLDFVERATAYRRASGDLRPLIVFPVPSRIELSEARLRQDWRLGSPTQGIEGYQTLFESVFREVYDLAECDLSAYFDEVQIPHVPRYAYGEEIAVVTERRGDSLSLGRRYQTLADRLVTQAGPWSEPGTSLLSETTLVAPEAPAVAPRPAPPARLTRSAIGLFVLSPLATVALLIGFGYFLLLPPSINDFHVVPSGVVAGSTATVSWSVDRARSVKIDPPITDQPLGANGSIDVTADATHEYTLSASNIVGLSSTARAVLAVARAQFNAEPNDIVAGQSATLSWRVEGANDRMVVRIDPDIGVVSASGQVVVKPTATTPYALTLLAPDGASQTQNVTVEVRAPPPTINVFTSPTTSVYAGEAVVLTWSVQNADSIQIRTGAGENLLDGSKLTGTIAVVPVAPTTFILTATNSSGTAEAALNIDVQGRVSTGATPRPTTAPRPQPTQPPTPTPTPSRLLLTPGRLSPTSTPIRVPVG